MCAILCYAVLHCIESTLLWLSHVPARYYIVNGRETGIGLHESSHIVKSQDMLQRASPSLIQSQELVKRGCTRIQ